MRLLIIFPFYIIFTHLGATKAIVFFHFPRSIQHPVFQSLSSDQANDDDNQIPPFPSFFSVFRHRNLNPFQNFWGFSIKTSTPESTTKDESKVNDTSDFKTDNITDQNGTIEASTLTPKHHILKKDMENSTKLLSLKRYYHPWSRFISLSGPDFKPLAYNWRNTKDTKNLVTPTQTGTHLENYLTANSSNDTQGNVTKESLPHFEENCTHRHYISRYLFIWTINWASLAVHLTAILLLSSFVTVVIILCRSCCSQDQSTSQIYKIKPLNV